VSSWIVDAAQLSWRDTPYPGIRWKKLRFDPESGNSVILLEFAPGTAYGGHRHPAGEEYWVLSGSLEDGAASYGAGTYVRHPPGSAHRPRSAEGCTLLVWLPEPIEILDGAS